MAQLRYVLLAVTLVVLIGVSAVAVNVPNAFVAGETIRASEMNANFAALEAAVSALETQVAEAQAAKPVMASAKVSDDVLVDSTTMVDVVVVSIDAPAAGVVLVQFTAQAAISGTLSRTGMAFQIDTTAGGSPIAGQYYNVGLTPADSDAHFLPVATQRVFEVEAGNHEFRAEARAYTLDGSRWMWNPRITATWYPADSVDLSGSTITTRSAGGDNRR